MQEPWERKISAFGSILGATTLKLCEVSKIVICKGREGSAVLKYHLSLTKANTFLKLTISTFFLNFPFSLLKFYYSLNYYIILETRKSCNCKSLPN